MTDLEDRLRDAFRALDDDISVPARRDVARRRLPSTRVLLAAAAVVALIATVTLASLVRSPGDDVGVFAQAIAPAEFNDRV
ncbi:MAG: hypothetical protein QOD30_399, partial [Actinomycetota bacterium]|nr:hypothetical protein [Actinomycetota bacterium]